MTFDLYVWKAPRDLDDEQATELVRSWEEAGGDPAASPFEPSDDVGWFVKELVGDEPELELSTDARPTQSRAPIWLATTEEAPARVVAIRFGPSTTRGALDSIFGLATKYDLVVFDPARTGVHHPLDEMAAYASATFWPRGAIRAAVAGLAGGAIGLAAWMLGIPILSGLIALAGGFMFVMAIWSFIHEGRIALRGR